MKRTPFFLLALLAFVLIQQACSPKMLSTAQVDEVRNRASIWANNFSSRNWESLEFSYSHSVDFNTKDMGPMAILKTKRTFFEENQAFLPQIDPASFEVDSVTADKVFGHFEVKGRWEGYEGETQSRIYLVWLVSENSEGEIIMQVDNLGQDAQKLKKAYQEELLAGAPFHDYGPPNFSWWETRSEEVKERFDELLFFASYGGKEYFWGARGEYNKGGWRPESFRAEGSTFSMGMVDGEGNTIVPTDYDIVGSIGAVLPDLIEVQKNGKKGLYDLDGNLFLGVDHDFIWPIFNDPEGRLAWVKKDGEVFAIDQSGKAMFPESGSGQSAESDLPQLADYLSSIPWKSKFNPFSEDFSATLLGGLGQWEYAWGMVMTPSFLAETGLYPDYYYANHLEDLDYGDSRFIDSIVKLADGSLGLFATFEHWGIGGRESFHTVEHQYAKLESGNQQFGEYSQFASYELYESLCRNGDFRFKGNGLVEVLSNGSYDKFYFYPDFSYYRLSESGNIEKKASNRLFPFTQFVQVDSIYFYGCFVRSLDEGEVKSQMGQIHEDEEYRYSSYRATSKHLPFDHLDIMVNEIYADYGYKFKQKKWQDYFGEKEWYEPRYESVDTLLSSLDSLNIHYIRAYQKRHLGEEESLIDEQIDASDYY